MSVRLVKLACNTAIRNLSWCIEIIGSLSIKVIQCRIKGSSNLSDELIPQMNKEYQKIPI